MSAEPPAPPAPRSGRPGRGSRREFAICVIACVGGGGLLLWAASRGWLTVSVTRARPLPDLSRSFSGRDVEPLAAAIGLVGLAGAVALVATRRIGRFVVAALLAVTGLLVAVRSARYAGGVSDSRAAGLLRDREQLVGVAARPGYHVQIHQGAVALAVAGGVLIAAAGLLAMLRGTRWPAMGRRYEAPSSVSAPPTVAQGRRPADADPAAADRQLWDALDRGDDPTPTRRPGGG